MPKAVPVTMKQHRVVAADHRQN